MYNSLSFWWILKVLDDILMVGVLVALGARFPSLLPESFEVARLSEWWWVDGDCSVCENDCCGCCIEFEVTVSVFGVDNLIFFVGIIDGSVKVFGLRATTCRCCCILSFAFKSLDVSLILWLILLPTAFDDALILFEIYTFVIIVELVPTAELNIIPLTPVDRTLFSLSRNFVVSLYVDECKLHRTIHNASNHSAYWLIGGWYYAWFMIKNNHEVYFVCFVCRSCEYRFTKSSSVY